MRNGGDERAFSLIEVTIAVGIIAVAAIVVLGLLPAGISSVRNSALDESAAEILFSAAADMRLVSDPAKASPRYRLYALKDPPEKEVIYFDSHGNEAAIPEKAAFRLEATPFVGSNPHTAAWHLCVIWPPQAPSSAASFLENVVILNRP